MREAFINLLWIGACVFLGAIGAALFRILVLVACKIESWLEKDD